MGAQKFLRNDFLKLKQKRTSMYNNFVLHLRKPSSDLQQNYLNDNFGDINLTKNAINFYPKNVTTNCKSNLQYFFTTEKNIILIYQQIFILQQLPQKFC